MPLLKLLFTSQFFVFPMVLETYFPFENGMCVEGNCEGKGIQRERELYHACASFGISKNSVLILHDPKLQAKTSKFIKTCF